MNQRFVVKNSLISLLSLSALLISSACVESLAPPTNPVNDVQVFMAAVKKIKLANDDAALLAALNEADQKYASLKPKDKENLWFVMDNDENSVQILAGFKLKASAQASKVTAFLKKILDDQTPINKNKFLGHKKNNQTALEALVAQNASTVDPTIQNTLGNMIFLLIQQGDNPDLLPFKPLRDVFDKASAVEVASIFARYTDKRKFVEDAIHANEQIVFEKVYAAVPNKPELEDSFYDVIRKARANVGMDATIRGRIIGYFNSPWAGIAPFILPSAQDVLAAAKTFANAGDASDLADLIDKLELFVIDSDTALALVQAVDTVSSETLLGLFASSHFNRELYEEIADILSLLDPNDAEVAVNAPSDTSYPLKILLDSQSRFNDVDYGDVFVRTLGFFSDKAVDGDRLGPDQFSLYVRYVPLTKLVQVYNNTNPAKIRAWLKFVFENNDHFSINDFTRMYRHVDDTAKKFLRSALTVEATKVVKASALATADADGHDVASDAIVSNFIKWLENPWDFSLGDDFSCDAHEHHNVLTLIVEALQGDLGDDKVRTLISLISDKIRDAMGLSDDDWNNFAQGARNILVGAAFSDELQRQTLAITPTTAELNDIFVKAKQLVAAGDAGDPSALIDELKKVVVTKRAALSLFSKESDDNKRLLGLMFSADLSNKNLSDEILRLLSLFGGDAGILEPEEFNKYVLIVNDSNSRLLDDIYANTSLAKIDEWLKWAFETGRKNGFNAMYNKVSADRKKSLRSSLIIEASTLVAKAALATTAADGSGVAGDATVIKIVNLLRNLSSTWPFDLNTDYFATFLGEYNILGAIVSILSRTEEVDLMGNKIQALIELVSRSIKDKTKLDGPSWLSFAHDAKIILEEAGLSDQDVYRILVLESNVLSPSKLDEHIINEANPNKLSDTFDELKIENIEPWLSWAFENGKSDGFKLIYDNAGSSYKQKLLHTKLITEATKLAQKAALFTDNVDGSEVATDPTVNKLLDLLDNPWGFDLLKAKFTTPMGENENVLTAIMEVLEANDLRDPKLEKLIHLINDNLRAKKSMVAGDGTVVPVSDHDWGIFATNAYNMAANSLGSRDEARALLGITTTIIDDVWSAVIDLAAKGNDADPAEFERSYDGFVQNKDKAWELLTTPLSLTINAKARRLLTIPLSLTSNYSFLGYLLNADIKEQVYDKLAHLFLLLDLDDEQKKEILNRRHNGLYPLQILTADRKTTDEWLGQTLELLMPHINPRFINPEFVEAAAKDTLNNVNDLQQAAKPVWREDHFEDLEKVINVVNARCSSPVMQSLWSKLNSKDGYGGSSRDTIIWQEWIKYIVTNLNSTRDPKKIEDTAKAFRALYKHLYKDDDKDDKSDLVSRSLKFAYEIDLTQAESLQNVILMLKAKLIPREALLEPFKMGISTQDYFSTSVYAIFEYVAVQKMVKFAHDQDYEKANIEKAIIVLNSKLQERPIDKAWEDLDSFKYTKRIKGKDKRVPLQGKSVDLSNFLYNAIDKHLIGQDEAKSLISALKGVVEEGGNLTQWNDLINSPNNGAQQNRSLGALIKLISTVTEAELGFYLYE